MARYKDAIKWMADNDDTEWVENHDPPSVTAALVADLFSKSDETVQNDLFKELHRTKPDLYEALEALAEIGNDSANAYKHKQAIAALKKARGEV